MKCLRSVTIILFMTHLSQAQEYGIKYMRYEEDFQYLQDSSSLNIYEKIKFISLHTDKTTWLTLGGELRYQYQFFKEEEWGNVANDNNGFILVRNMLHTDLHLNKHFRFFSQFKSNSIHSREVAPKRIDVNAFDVHQSFFDYNNNIGQYNLNFRAGRQEIKLGSQRLVTVREGPNNRLTFDGICTTLQSKNSKWDVFYLHPIIDKPEILDDNFNAENKIYGLYSVFNNIKIIENIDLYYIVAYNKTAIFNGNPNNETRHSIGTRIWDTKGNWTYDFEGVFQFGQFGDQNIVAYTTSLHTNYTFKNIKFEPQLGLKTEVISGDKDPNDNRLNSFNPLYPRGAYFGLAALIGPVNLIDIHPYVEFKIAEELTFGIDYDWFWRNSTLDRIYGPNVRPIFTNNITTEKFIGGQLGADFNYQVSEFFGIVLEGTWFKAGDYLKAVSLGKDIWFTALTFQFKF